MSASEEKLGALHDLVCDALIEGTKGATIAGDEGALVTLPPAPAMLQAAIKFLNDNKVTCAPSADNKLGALSDQLKKRRAEGAMPQELADALDAVGHSNMRPN